MDGGAEKFSGKLRRWQKVFLKVLQRKSLKGSKKYPWKLFDQCIAEMLGVFFIVLFGVGSVCNAVLNEYNSGLWQVTVVWGLGVALAIYVTTGVSGGHLNPAVSLAFAIFRPDDFPWSKLLPYWLAQYMGGILGGAFNLLLFGSQFRRFEIKAPFSRGDPKSVLTASAFGEYFPNPGYGGIVEKGSVGILFALFIEAWGTGILMFVLFAFYDKRAKVMRNAALLPFWVGFVIAVVMTLHAPLTQTGLNPASDFGPRIVAALAGWGRIAIPGPRSGFWIYILGPHLGAIVGAALYDIAISPGLDSNAPGAQDDDPKAPAQRPQSHSEDGLIVNEGHIA